MKKSGGIITSVVGLLILAVGLGIYLNWQWISDFYRGMNYQVSSEMEGIRNSLDLTERGEFLFAASWPELNASEDFNRYCQVEDTEIAILGCYKDETIYVYNIDEAELNGIVETTTAHELLHAVFARMSENEKETLRPSLEDVLEKNKEVLSADLETYEESERFEELYVRAGTEVKELPDDLEKHYSEIFKDQNKIVAFYDKYIGVFRELNDEIERLRIEIEDLNGEIESKTGAYERELAQLNADIVSFNSCAEVAGCFKTESEFNVRRNKLITKQTQLEAKYNVIEELIDEYNERVEGYNKDVLRRQDLNKAINSSKRPDKI